MTRSPPDYRLDPPEDDPEPCPHCGLDPSCDCRWEMVETEDEEEEEDE